MEHPHGVQPWGNFLAGGAKDNRRQGLGLLAALPDEVLLAVLSELGAADLARAAAASRALYCYAYHEELWRALTLERYQAAWSFQGSWQRTFKVAAGLCAGQQQQGGEEGEQGEGQQRQEQQQQPGSKAPAERQGKKRRKAGASRNGAGPALQLCPWQWVPGVARTPAAAPPPAGRRRGKAGSKLPASALADTAAALEAASPAPGTGSGVPAPVRVQGLYSDLLYQPWHCATVPLSPEWLTVETVPREAGLSATDFRERYEQPNRPVIITDVVPGWPAYRKWTPQYLEAAYGTAPAIVGGYDMPFGRYMRYAERAGGEDMPLYLFDRRFAVRAPMLAADYTVPEYFRDDLFGLLGGQRAEGASRPDYRWLIVGPARSGSSFHKDPNSTSAWNGVVAGAKRWLLLPPGAPPPGVHPSGDGADVAAPVSLVEWYLNFYQAAREMDPPPLECTLRAGELLFVPRGWWHAALNLEPCVAVTQNFVSPVTLPHAAAFLSDGRSDALVSGCSEESDCRALRGRFLAALREHRPELAAMLDEQQGRAEQRRKKEAALAALFAGPGSKHARAPAGTNGGGNAGTQCSGPGQAVVAAGQGEEEAAVPVQDTAIPAGGGFSFNFAL